MRKTSRKGSIIAFKLVYKILYGEQDKVMAQDKKPTLSKIKSNVSTAARKKSIKDDPDHIKI